MGIDDLLKDKRHLILRIAAQCGASNSADAPLGVPTSDGFPVGTRNGVSAHRFVNRIVTDNGKAE